MEDVSIKNQIADYQDLHVPTTMLFNDAIDQGFVSKPKAASIVSGAIRSNILHDRKDGLVLPSIGITTIHAKHAFGSSYYEEYKREVEKDIKNHLPPKEANNEIDYFHNIFNESDIFLFGGLFLTYDTKDKEKQEKIKHTWCVGEVMWNCSDESQLKTEGTLQKFLNSIPPNSFMYGSCSALEKKCARATQFILGYAPNN